MIHRRLGDNDGAGEQRLSLAATHERAVYEKVRPMVDNIELFGQSQLSKEMRWHLRRTKSALRWLPDLLAVRRDFAWLIDAKEAQRLDTPNWSIEKNAHSAHQRQQEALGHPIVYVWHDFTCSYLDDLTHEVVRQGFFNGSGSGTDFWLVPKSITRSLVRVFRPDQQATG